MVISGTGADTRPPTAGDGVIAFGSAESSALRRCIRDMVAITSLPAVWLGRNQRFILEHVAETLRALVGADLVYAKLQSVDGSDCIDALEVEPGCLGDACAAEVRDLLRANDGLDKEFTLKCPQVKRPLTLSVTPFGYHGAQGYIAAGSYSPDFPDDSQQILSQVIANQAAISLRAADLVRRLNDTVSTLRTVADNAAACIFLLDRQGRCTYMNPASERVLGYTLDDVAGRVLHDIIHCRHGDGSLYPAGDCPLNAAVSTGLTLREYEDEILRKDGSSVPVLCASSPIVSNGDVIATIVEAYDITERKRTERELLSKADRESLLSRIGLTIRSSLASAEIEKLAAEQLASALAADRCFFAHIDLGHDYLRIGTGWRRGDLQSLAGEYRVSEFGVDCSTLFSSGANMIERDFTSGAWSEQTLSKLRAMRIGAAITIPFYRQDRLVALLCAAMETPRDWTAEEIALAEAVAAQTRSAIDAAEVVQREHRIATTLQSALIPPAPANLPGLDLATHYRAALEESSIGGDFFAVYPIAANRYALIIGDVSGKGLAAASQVAAVQNMLRYALCVSNTLPVALTEMNRILISQELLKGFVTLFVAIYDAARRTLTYVSCGHEPALIRRASGEIDHLWPSGPAIGILDEPVFSEHSVTLEPDDVLLIYTDGLSEAGSDRRHLMGIDGLAAILRRSPAVDAGGIVNEVISQANRFAHGAFHDDVCIVAAVATH